MAQRPGPSGAATPAERTIGVVVVHGMGDQDRYDHLKHVAGAFDHALTRLDPESRREFLVATAELSRSSKRPPDRSEPRTEAGTAVARADERLFRPVTIRLPGRARIRFYEAYWADEDLQFTRFQKLRYNFWLLTTIWNPILNKVTRRFHQRSFGWLVLAGRTVHVFAVGLVYHLAEAALAMLPFFTGRREPTRRISRVLYEYAGDVKLYADQEPVFHNQTKREVLQARFDEVLIKAYLESDEVHVLADSLGSVIAYDALTRHRTHPSKMAGDFHLWLEGSSAVADTRSGNAVRGSRVEIDLFSKLRTFVSVGSPLDKFYFFWPTQRVARAQSGFALVKQGPESQGRWQHEWLEGGGTPAEHGPFRWFNFEDVVDPIGASLDSYDDVEGLPGPTNCRFAHWFLPSKAHTGYWYTPRLVDWLAWWIALRDESDSNAGGDTAQAASTDKPPDGGPPRPDESLATHWGRWLPRFALATAMSLASVVVLGGAVVVLTDFTSSVAHDWYMDAESNTIFARLHWLDQALLWGRETLGFESQRWLPVVLGHLRVMGAIALLSLAFAVPAYFRNEGELEERRAREAAMYGDGR